MLLLIGEYGIVYHTTTTILTISYRAYIFVSLLLSRSMESGNRTFNFDCGIGLSSCGILTVECCGGILVGRVVSGVSLAQSN